MRQSSELAANAKSAAAVSAAVCIEEGPSPFTQRPLPAATNERDSSRTSHATRIAPLGMGHEAHTFAPSDSDAFFVIR
jgi:hypothetical protein